MTDDEISELAECLADACERSLYRVSASGQCCPFGALNPLTPGRLKPLHYTVVQFVPGITAEEADAFMCGFDDVDCPSGDPRLFALGRLFAELYP